MKDYLMVAFLLVGIGVGYLLSGSQSEPFKVVDAGDSRYQDFMISTGRVSIGQNIPTEGVWLLDYRTGKLLGTMINRNNGKIMGWAEVDLVREFTLQPKQDVHFIMTTGDVNKGQAALYLAETSTGKMGVYTMGPREGLQDGVAIRRHDMVFFRKPPEQN